MFKEIVVNNGEEESKAAVLEDGVTVEFYMDRRVDHRLIGNVYKGRVENVLPGMQAAFVDIGLEKNAFLYIEDAIIGRNAGDNGAKHDYSRLNIGDYLKQGQELLVQVAKEAIGTKGPRVTTQITLPGRYLVLMPTVDYIGVSRRIESEEERERLRDLAVLVKPKDMGLIVRTMAEGVDEEEFRRDIRVVGDLWRNAILRSAAKPAPYLVHSDLDLVQRILRDIFAEDVDRLTLDSRNDYERVLDLLESFDSGLKTKVFLNEKEDIFADYGVDQEIERALRRKVWLKSGGYLIIDQAEALTAIDVNTGKFVGTTNLEDTVLKTNLEAAKEIARHLRLRNIGGIIIIDFIDMFDEEHRSAVLRLLEEEVKKDKTKISIFGITRLGLMEITRKKTQPSLSEVLQKQCPYCGGRGTLHSEDLGRDIQPPGWYSEKQYCANR